MGSWRIELNELEITQRFQTVAFEICLVVDRNIAQLGTRLDVEDEQEPVNQPQALERELRGVELASARKDASLPFLRQLPQLPRRLVAEQLDRLAQRELQILAHAEGVLVRLLVEAVEQ